MLSLAYIWYLGGITGKGSHLSRAVWVLKVAVGLLWIALLINFTLLIKELVLYEGWKTNHSPTLLDKRAEFNLDDVVVTTRSLTRVQTQVAGWWQFEEKFCYLQTESCQPYWIKFSKIQKHNVEAVHWLIKSEGPGSNSRRDILFTRVFEQSHNLQMSQVYFDLNPTVSNLAPKDGSLLVMNVLLRKAKV